VLEAGISAEAEGIARPSEPGGLATSVASPELAEEMGVAAGSELPAEEATGVSSTLDAAGAATPPPLEAAGTVTPPPLAKSTTAGPGQVNFCESL
jgi:hypothetical protein